MHVCQQITIATTTVIRLNEQFPLLVCLNFFGQVHQKLKSQCFDVISYRCALWFFRRNSMWEANHRLVRAFLVGACKHT